MKLKWKIGDKPTGRYRSFHKRGWPTASIRGDKDDRPVAALYAEDGEGYHSHEAEKKTLIVRVMDWRGDKPKWLTLKKREVGVTKAKEAALLFLTKYPQLLPKDKS